MIDRRQFITKGSALALATSTLPGFAKDAVNKEPRFSLALSQYSLRAMLKDKSLDALDFPAFSVNTFGIKAIDLWEGGLPQG